MDEIAAKESIQIQQQLTQSVNSVSKNPSVTSTSSVNSVSMNSAVLPSSGEVFVYFLFYAKVSVQTCLRLLSRIRTLVFHVEILATCDQSANLGMLHVATITQEDILLVLAGRME